MLAVLVAALAVARPAGAENVTATAVDVAADDAATTFEITLSKGVTAEIFTLANPYRVIVDLPEVAFELPADIGRHGRGLISAFRYGLFAESKARVVIDAVGPVRIARADMKRLGQGEAVKLAISLAKIDAAAFGDGTGASRGAPKSQAPGPVAAPRARKSARPVVMIDAGHGGVDPGASGSGGIAEKTVVLAVAQALQSALAKIGRYEVLMTRASDVFVSLDRRLKMSEDAGAELFISLHADAIAEANFADAVRGATIYTLSERASDEQARRIAEKENASDLIAGIDAAETAAGDQVKSILIDLMRRETKNFSTDFSNTLAERLGKSIAMSRDPQRSAAFKVLKQAQAPSVLVELGYMSNASDQQQMTTGAWQDKVAAAVAAAVDAYFSKRTAREP